MPTKREPKEQHLCLITTTARDPSSSPMLFWFGNEIGKVQALENLISLSGYKTRKL